MSTQYLGPFRWRGSLNWKDVVERAIAGTISGLAAGLAFYLATRVLG